MCVGTRRERDEVKLDYGAIACPLGFFGFIFVGNRQPLVILTKGEMQLARASIRLIPPQNPSSLLGRRENKGSERRGRLPGGSQEIVSGTAKPEAHAAVSPSGRQEMGALAADAPLFSPQPPPFPPAVPGPTPSSPP